MMELILTPKPPYDFQLVLHYLQRSDLETVDRVMDDAFMTLLTIRSSPVLIHVTGKGTMNQPELLVRIQGADEKVLDDVSRYLNRRFHLQDDPEPFYQQVGKDPVMRPLLELYRGLKPVQAGSLFEALSWAIIGQQINIQFTYSLKKTLVDLTGNRLEHCGELFFAFPEPQAVAALTYEDLTERRFSRRKAEYLIDFARKVAAGEVLLEWGSEKDPEAILTDLTRIRGIGRWTAEYGLMRGLGYPDVLPAADIGLRNALQRLCGLKSQPDEETVRSIGGRWEGWRSWAAFYLWFDLAYRRRYPDSGSRG